jgi:A/G-specific adenine glycosylase
MLQFSKILRVWYSNNARILPWRQTNDPYKIWLSEIILQQTRVEQGMPYYNKFIENYKTVADLAEAPLDEVLLLWQGLGYYSRARNLHKAANQIVEVFNGEFPNNHDQIKSLVGIGDYTAAAISSFAYNLPFAVVDGNVYRFLSRYFGITTPIDGSAGKKEFAELAQKLIDPEHPAMHNQAIMEIGAMVCKPSNPNCNECPFQASCFAFNNGVINDLPVKSKKTKVRTRYFNYVIFQENEHTLLTQRREKDIWQGLFEFPLIETESETDLEMINQEIRNRFSISKFEIIHTAKNFKHLLSHQTIYAKFWVVKVNLKKLKVNDSKIVSLDNLNLFAMPQLIAKYLKNQQ